MTPRPGKGRHLGEFEFIVLAAVLRVGEEAYAVEIRRTIEESIDRKTAIGAVYATLDRLERKGYVTSHFGPPTPSRGGKAKRFFTVETKGVDALRTTLRNHLALAEGLDLVSTP